MYLARPLDLDIPGDIPRRRVESGKTLFLQEEKAECYYVVETGRVELRRRTPNRSVLLSILSRSEPAGLIAFERKDGYLSEAVTSSDVVVARITRDRHQWLRSRRPELLEQLLLNVAQRRAELEDRLHAQSLLDLSGKIACQICKLSRLFQEHSREPSPIDLPFTRQMLADMVGARVESVIRRMSRWETKGLIQSESGSFTVLDYPRLREQASMKCGTCAYLGTT